MKTKRVIGLLLGCLTMSILTSCGNPEEEQKALAKVIDGGIASSFSSGTPLLAQDGDQKNETSMTGDENESLSVTSKQITKVNGTQYTVNFEWKWDNQFKDVISIRDLKDDEYHKHLCFNYPGVDESDLSVTFKVVAKCGSQSTEKTYNVLLTHTTLKYDDVSISSLYKTNAAGTNFEIVDETTGYIKANYNQKYYYVSVSGKVIYVAADKNWALIANGKDVLQLYRVDEANDKDLVEVGNYVKVFGDMSNGYGNLQLAYISKVELLSDHSAIADLVEQEVPNGLNNKSDAGFKSFFSGISNAVTTFTGTANAKVTFSGLVRATLKLNLDGADGNFITIAYDYHSGTPDKSTLNETGTAYKTIFDQVVKGTKIKVRGTLRWSDASGNNTISANGSWTITPFDLTDISLA